MRTTLKASALALFYAAAATATTRYASPSGSGSACTNINTPCSLQAFADGSVTLNPGDTVILKNGTYTNASAAFLMRFGSGVSGTLGNKITFQAETWRGVTLDCKNNQPAAGSTGDPCISNPFTTSQYIKFKDLIITNSSTATRITTGLPNVDDGQDNPAERPGPMTMNRKGWEIEHCIIKNNTMGFDGDGSAAAGPRSADWILNYYNGYSWSDRGHGHGVYVQATGTSESERLTIKDTFNWNNGYAGVQVYTAGGSKLNYVTLDGAVIFKNGIGTTGHWLSTIARTPIVWGGEGNSSCNIAGEPLVSQFPIIKNSEVWEPRANSGGVSIGYRKGTYGLSMTNNFFAFNDAAIVISRVPSTATVDGLCANATISNNTIYGSISGANFPPLTCNEYGTGNVCTGTNSLPTTGQRKVYKKYDGRAGEGALVVYNWSLASTVTFDPLQAGGFAGEAYNLYTNNDPMTPIASATWNGTDILTLNTSGYTPETIGGTGWDTPTESGPAFIVFFFEPQAAVALPTATPTNTPTRTSTPTATRTNTPSLTPTKTSTATVTNTPSLTPTRTNTPVLTFTPTRTFTQTNTPSRTNTPTRTFTATPTITPTFTRTPTATPVGGILPLTFEGEQCNVTAPMLKTSDATVFGGQYVSSSTANQGKITCLVSVPDAGVHYVWVRVYGADTDHDSFNLDVDGDASPACVTDDNTTCAHIFNTASNKSPDVCELERTWGSWLWIPLNDATSAGDGCGSGEGAHRTLDLTAGVHTLTFRTREAGARIDRVILTLDPNYTPSDFQLTPTPRPNSGTRPLRRSQPTATRTPTP